MSHVTIVGNLTEAPELRFTANGKAVASFTVAESQRVKSPDGTWTDGPSTFWRCSLWDSAAENLAESLDKGQRVILLGGVRQRSFETKSGEKRSVMEVTVSEIGPSLRWATAKPQKTSSSAPKAKPQPKDDPWTSDAGFDAGDAPF